MKKILIGCLFMVAVVMPGVAVAGTTDETQGGKIKVWTAGDKELHPPIDQKPATRRDIIAGQIYAAFISKYDANAFKGGSYTVAGSMINGDNGTELMKASIIAADELIKKLDAGQNK